MEHGYIIGRKGTMELMKLSKVNLHRVLPPSQLPKGGWRKSSRTMFVVPLELVKKDERMEKDVLFRCALRMKEDYLELVWQRAAEQEAVLGKLWGYVGGESGDGSGGEGGGRPIGGVVGRQPSVGDLGAILGVKTPGLGIQAGSPLPG